MTTDRTKVFALRLEGICNLYRHGAISREQFLERASKLPFGSSTLEPDENFESLAGITKRILEGLRK